ncbi:MAG: S8 family peptidase [Pseudonocardiaceae bacterium]
MPRRPTVALLAMTVAAGLASAAPATGQPEQPDLARGLPPAAGLPLAPPVPDVIGSRLRGEQGPVTVFVELERTPAIDAYNAARRAGRDVPGAREAANAAKGVVSQTVDAVLATLRSRGAVPEELYRTVNAVPGLAVTADAARIRELAAVPEVRSVRKIVPKSIQNSNAVQLTRALQVWRQTGRFGDGVRIGIIDDGIDYTHANYGGPGTPEAYAAIDRNRAAPGAFPTAKVVGGTDFAGDDYDASGAAGPGALVPKPDPNPLSCGDHGNHVAGSASGFGVNADGTTFTGDYRQLDAGRLDRMRVGPGTAPKALLYALKVFGCAGSTNLTAQAMDRALDPDGDGDFSDRLDVVNLSLGSDYGAPDDPDSLFVRKLAGNGVLPVFSAGNGGDLYDIGGAPGNTPEALTVASSRDSYVLRDGAEVTAPAGVAGVKGGQYSQEFTGYATLDRTAPVVPLSDPANLDGCQPYSAADAAAVAGKHVWLEWDDNGATRRCGSATRAANAQAAGAAGVLLTSTLQQFAAGIAGNVGVPQFQFTGSDTAALRPALEAGTLSVRLAGVLRTSVRTDAPLITDTPSTFTSRSVRSPAVKPDVAAPGDTIASALTGSGNGTLVISGTSMASPHVAGIGALVRQARPDWTVEEVKAAVMNTAGADVFSRDGQQGPIEAPNRVGSGRVDARSALGNQVLAMVEDDPGQVSANFGVVEVSEPTTLSKTIKVVNKGQGAASYGAAYQPITTIPGVSYELSTEEVSLGPREVARMTVTMRIDDPAALRKTADPTIEKTQLGAARQFLADASGRIVLTPQDPGAGAPQNPGVGAPQDTVALRVPVYSAPKPVAAVATPDRLLFRGQENQAVLDVAGRGMDQGSGDAAYRSVLSVLQLQAQSPQLPACGDGRAVDCTPNETAKGGDIRYVGATSTAPLANRQGRPQDALLAFGMTTWGDWYNVGSNTLPFVDFDTTGDGLPDFETYVTKLPETDVLVATTVDLHVPGFPTVDQQPVNGQFGDVDTNVFDSNVIVLPVSLAALRIDPAAALAPVTYTAGVAGIYTGPGDTDGIVDTVGPVLFDAVRPGLWAQGDGDPALSYLARPGTALVVNRDPVAALLQQANDLLVLHHHNASGDRAQLVEIRAPGQITPPVRLDPPGPLPIPPNLPAEPVPDADAPLVPPNLPAEPVPGVDVPLVPPGPRG